MQGLSAKALSKIVTLEEKSSIHSSSTVDFSQRKVCTKEEFDVILQVYNAFEIEVEMDHIIGLQN